MASIDANSVPRGAPRVILAAIVVLVAAALAVLAVRQLLTGDADVVKDDPPAGHMAAPKVLLEEVRRE